jgi:hypothetical protein
MVAAGPGSGRDPHDILHKNRRAGLDQAHVFRERQGVDTDSITNKTLRQLRDELDQKQWKTLMKHFEGRDLRHGK